MDHTLFNEALAFALKAHDGVSRKTRNIPFLLHPMEVAAIAATITEDSEVLAAALLHDTVEDAGVDIEEIRERFGEKVAFLVASETENKHRELLPEDSWYMRKKESLDRLKELDDRDVKILWLSDKLSNLRSFYRIYRKKKERLWEDFHQRDPKKQEWYYRTVYEYTKELSETHAYREYEELLNRMFGKENAEHDQQSV